MKPSPYDLLILSELRLRRIEVRVIGNNIACQPASLLTASQIGRIKTHKRAIIERLAEGPFYSSQRWHLELLMQSACDRGQDELAEDLAFTFEERCAICTTMGDLSEDDAQLIAIWELIFRHGDVLNYPPTDASDADTSQQFNGKTAVVSVSMPSKAPRSPARTPSSVSQ